VIEVEAWVEDEVGGSDAAYDLLGEFTPEDFCKELLALLKDDWGLTHAVGDVTLHIQITNKQPKRNLDVDGKGYRK